MPATMPRQSKTKRTPRDNQPQLAFRLAPDLEAAYQDFRDRQLTRPQVQAVCDAALRFFLRANGYPNLAEKEPAD